MRVENKILEGGVYMKINEVSFAYDSTKKVFSRLNFEFEENNIYVLLGENGVGKTTLLKLILGILEPDSGQVDKSGYVVSYLPDHNAIYSRLTLEENIIMRMALYNQKYQLTDEIKKYLDEFKLSEYRKTKVEELSLGNTKKVAILTSCLIDADLLVLDEPTIALDTESKQALVDLINERRKKKKIILIVTHDKELIDALDARLIRIVDGVIEHV